MLILGVTVYAFAAGLLWLTVHRVKQAAPRVLPPTGPVVHPADVRETVDHAERYANGAGR
jgi:hypothetical protein